MNKKQVPKFKIVNKRNIKESDARYYVTSCGVVCGENDGGAFVV